MISHSRGRQKKEEQRSLAGDAAQGACRDGRRRRREEEERGWERGEDKSDQNYPSTEHNTSSLQSNHSGPAPSPLPQTSSTSSYSVKAQQLSRNIEPRKPRTDAALLRDIVLSLPQLRTPTINDVLQQHRMRRAGDTLLQSRELPRIPELPWCSNFPTLPEPASRAVSVSASRDVVK